MLWEITQIRHLGGTDFYLLRKVKRLVKSVRGTHKISRRKIYSTDGFQCLLYQWLSFERCLQ